MRYKKQITLFLIFLLPMWANAAGHSENKAAENTTGSIGDIAHAFKTYFPKTTGKIAAVENHPAGDVPLIVIQSENETGLSPGVLLAVYSEGDPFYHPVTRAVLGHFEEEIAQLEVISIASGQVTAKVIGTSVPVIGNLVRLTAARIPIDISGTATASGGVTEQGGTSPANRFLMRELRSALEEGGRFAISKQPLYSITLAVTSGLSSGLVKIEMKNVKTGTIVSNIETTLQPDNESDTIFESLQYRLFDKQQRGIPTK